MDAATALVTFVDNDLSSCTSGTIITTAYAAEYNGAPPIDREMREICTQPVRRFEDAGCVVEEGRPELDDLTTAFLTRRSLMSMNRRSPSSVANRATVLKMIRQRGRSHTSIPRIA